MKVSAQGHYLVYIPSPSNGAMKMDYLIILVLFLGLKLHTYRVGVNLLIHKQSIYV